MNFKSKFRIFCFVIILIPLANAEDKLECKLADVHLETKPGYEFVDKSKPVIFMNHKHCAREEKDETNADCKSLTIQFFDNPQLTGKIVATYTREFYKNSQKLVVDGTPVCPSNTEECKNDFYLVWSGGDANFDQFIFYNLELVDAKKKIFSANHSGKKIYGQVPMQSGEELIMVHPSKKVEVVRYDQYLRHSYNDRVKPLLDCCQEVISRGLESRILKVQDCLKDHLESGTSQALAACMQLAVIKLPKRGFDADRLLKGFERRSFSRQLTPKGCVGDKEQDTSLNISFVSPMIDFPDCTTVAFRVPKLPDQPIEIVLCNNSAFLF